jgi:5-formyltetrahydrofolate cyclo-ligase
LAGQLVRIRRNVTSDHSISRADLRTRLRAARAQLGAAERIAAASALVSTLELLPEFLIDTRVAGYWAVGGELPLNIALGRLRARAQNYYLPVLAIGNMLNFAAWDPDVAVRANRFGIPEPECAAAELVSPQDIDLVLVPLLGFDRHGNRLGAGAGYYDRSFAFLKEKTRPAQPLLVGIGYHFQELPELPPQPWDVALDFVATDRELIECAPRA